MDSFGATAEFTFTQRNGFCILLTNQSTCGNGTNGKTTLSSLISHVFKKMGQKNVLAGNMGYPLSQHLSSRSA